MQRPFEPEAPIDAGAVSRNHRAWLGAPLLLAACGQPAAEGPLTLAVVISNDDGVYEQLTSNAQIQIEGVVSGRFDQGAVVEMDSGLCTHLAMGRAEWEALMYATGAGHRVTVVGYKAPGPHSDPCRFHLDRVGIVAR